jgi:hypothetical protein
MLRIIIELVPFGKEELKRTIGGMTIANDGTGDHEYGNYKYELFDANTTLHEPTKIKGTLKNHYRIQSVFKIVQAVLNKALH